MLQRQSAPEKTPNWDSINTKIFEEEGVRFGEGGAHPCGVIFGAPTPKARGAQCLSVLKYLL